MRAVRACFSVVAAVVVCASSDLGKHEDVRRQGQDEVAPLVVSLYTYRRLKLRRLPFS